MSALAEQHSAAPAKAPAPAAEAPAPAKKTRIVFIDIGRGLGALLVFYSHIVHPWIYAKNDKAPYVDFIEALTTNPMHMSKQGIGQIAVPFFFLVSGFVVTPIALRQGAGRFALNRFIRVYAPMMFVVLLTVVLLLVNLHPPSTGQPQTLNPLTVLTNTTLANYLITPQVVLVPVAWTMIVEVLFYLLLMAILPLLRRSVWLAIAVELTFIFVVLMSMHQLGATWFLFAVNVSYLPSMLIGQVIWATTAKKIPLWTGALFGACAWSLYVLADIIGVGRVDNSYNLALAFAVVCFFMGMFAEDRLKQRKVWTMLSERSYSIYLLHMLVTFVLLQLLRPAVPLPLALLIVIPAVFGVVEVSYRYVERPSHALARRLSRKPSGSKPANPPATPPASAKPAEPAEAEKTQVVAPVPPVRDVEDTIEIPVVRVDSRPPRRPAPRPQPVPGGTGTGTGGNGRMPRGGQLPPPPPGGGATRSERTAITRAAGGSHRARPLPEAGADRIAEPPARRPMPPRRPSAPPELRNQPDQENQGQRGDYDDFPRHGNSFRPTPR
ncbi:acyltransferase family protein [Amycolatopsis benzoatilytica]|uniref:acyltransferase family protein n=1 Tax=Amycolatopsis benzoatilytica TaxID=346045 RepID=UPI000376BBEB|nr:acyltransferase [Amycolatopsis benzoatilytica]